MKLLLLPVLSMFACSGASTTPVSDPGDSGVDAGLVARDGASEPSLDGGTADGSQISHGPDGGGGRLSAGCGTTPANPASYTATTTDGNGTTRSYDVLVPAPYDSTTPLALTMVFHSHGGTPVESEAYGLQTGAGASESIFAFPRGIDFMGEGVGWDDRCSGYDMALFDHMLAELEAEYCIDTSRVFVAGFSWGCDHATALTCCRGDLIRAASVASCSDEYADTSDPTSYIDFASCPAPLQTAIRFTHDASGEDAGYSAPDFATTSKLYQTWLGCTASSALTPDVCNTYPGCDVPFIECPYTNLGHAIPPSWGPDTWSFFASFQ